MPAPKGNKFNSKFEKLKESGLVDTVYSSYCDHIADGKSCRSWCFENEQLNLTGQTMERYIREYPEEFPAIKKEIAHAKAYAYWEQIVEEHAKGNIKAVTPALQMVMRNKFGWDRNEKRESESLATLDQSLTVLRKAKNGKWASVDQ